MFLDGEGQICFRNSLQERGTPPRPPVAVGTDVFRSSRSNQCADGSSPPRDERTIQGNERQLRRRQDSPSPRESRLSAPSMVAVLGFLVGFQTPHPGPRVPLKGLISFCRAVERAPFSSCPSNRDRAEG